MHCSFRYRRNKSPAEAKVGGAKVGGAKVGGAKVGGAKVRGAKVGGAKVGGAKVGGSKVRGANVGGVKVVGSKVRGSKVGGANVGGVTEIALGNHQLTAATEPPEGKLPRVCIHSRLGVGLKEGFFKFKYKCSSALKDKLKKLQL